MKNIPLAACIVAWTLLVPDTRAFGQTAQVGADANASVSQKLRVDYLHYRPARWDTEHVSEYESEHPNQGGLLYFYVTNTSDKPLDLRFWRYNKRDESYWTLNHFVAWHRVLDRHLDPGRMTILEIDATSRDFGPELPFVFELVDDSWTPRLEYAGRLREDLVNVSYIHVHADMKEIEVFIRYTGAAPIELTNIELVGHKSSGVKWRGQQLNEAGYAIARMTLSEPLKLSTLLIAKVGLKTAEGERSIYAHRRAFADFFPIGTWGIDEHEQAFVSGDHIDTGVKGGKKDDAFFGGAAARFGLNALVHTGEPVNADMVRDLSGHPSVLCWMLRDEPDWSMDPQVVLFCDETVKAYDSTKPTFLNLCRNTKFFEYAPIADIPGHDHYCVTAPSSSKWPQSYGTYLEETAYYTKDLKYASEPKPIWVWSQGNHDGWSERPKRPVPTVEELSAQLVLNLGQGAKGILWFTYNMKGSERFPETRDAMRGWNRVMNVLREDFLATNPLICSVQAPSKVNVAPLLGWDKVILCVTNADYEIHREAYPFQAKRNVDISIDLPSWVTPKTAIRVDGSGVTKTRLTLKDNKATVRLGKLADAAIVMLSNLQETEGRYRSAFAALVAQERNASSGN